ncbi:MAPEG family protein [Pseudomonas sp. M30-35]|uniref:MAPEG family protein n=1 Tax=Pseudomonas sp. M30-35 TaxID=1981174 RepID=UPI000B3D3C1A|nr:MAPEG family protein [Pseudomonas sp. M30-35]ARU87228.1 MAPEG family protein [Pseudomonas sp. M30-35]
MTLSPSAVALLGLVAWTLFLLILMINQRGLLVLSGKLAVNGFSPDGSNTPGAFGQRLVRAHANCVENVPLMAAVLLYAMVVSQTSITDPLAGVLLAARIFQSCMHLISSSALFVWLRFAGLLVQIIITVWWLLRLSGLI